MIFQCNICKRDDGETAGMNDYKPVNDKNMTKADIVSRIAEQTGVEKGVVTSVVEGFMEQVRASLIGGEDVYLRGFGTYVG